MDIEISAADDVPRNWTIRLEEVLYDFDALQCFQSWLGVDDDSSEHPLRLHFAIIAFREMNASGDARSFQLAREIFNKFLRLRVGLCDFISAPIRERIGQRLKSQRVDGALFDECLASLDTFLRRQHALFVQSQEFLDFFNQSCLLRQQHQHVSTSADGPSFGPQLSSVRPPSSSGAILAQTPTSRRTRRRDSNSGDTVASKGQPLTADSLLRSQWEREAIIPSGGAGLFKPISKFPYMGQAHASKKESAVSSSFSSEANRRSGAVPSHSMRQLREGQRRANQTQRMHFLSAFPKPHPRRESSAVVPPNCHETAQGRREFAEKLAQKLRHVELQLQQDEAVNRQIERINSARQRDTKTSTRELIIAGVTADPLLLDATVADDDADDDVENYFRLRMMDSSCSNSAQQSPPLIGSGGGRRTCRKSHGSCSPTTVEDSNSSRVMIKPAQQQKQQPTTLSNDQSTGMTQSCCFHPSPFGRHFDAPIQNIQKSVPAVQLQSNAQQQLNVAQHRPPFATVMEVPSSASPRPHLSSSLHHSVLPPPLSSTLSQSVHLASPSAIPVPALPKQLPSFCPMKQMTSAYCDNDGDTSGIGSMTTTHSGNSAPAGNDRQRAAMFRRARELSSGGRSEMRNAQQQHQQGTGTEGGRPTGGSQPLTMAHPPPLRAQQQFPSPPSKGAKMPICFRDSSGDGVLVVAHVPHRPLTFREFRHHLSISSKDRRQFFFKSICEDGSAPYQLLLFNDDAAILPIFEGKVSAECRAPLSDSD